MKKLLLGLAGIALGIALLMAAGCTGTAYTSYSPYPAGYTGTYYMGGYGRHYHRHDYKQPKRENRPTRSSVGRPAKMPSRPPQRGGGGRGRGRR